MKKLIVIILALSMLLSLAACGGGSSSTTAAPAATTTAAPAATTTAAPAATTTAAPAATTTAAPAGETTTAAPAGETTTAASSSGGEWNTKGLPAIPAGCLSGDMIITSVGQSAEAETVGNLLKRAKIDGYTLNNTVTADAIPSSTKVVVLVVGGSTKGLGGAGLDQDQETKRVTAIIEKAEAAGMTIVCMHIGGTDRRGTLSDAFINLAFPHANYAVIEKTGDEDNLIYDILAAKNVPTAYIEKQTASRDVLAFMLGK